MLQTTDNLLLKMEINQDPLLIGPKQESNHHKINQ